MKRFRVSGGLDWFSQEEVITIIENMRDGEKIEIIKLEGDKL